MTSVDDGEVDLNGAANRRPAPVVVVVTGMSGAGRTTAIDAFEDMGYEAMENVPLSLFEALIKPVVGTSAPIAVGVESRTRGFSARALTETVEALRNTWRAGAALLYLDCADNALITRFNQTRRRHPLAPEEDAATGIQRERDILRDVRQQADILIDTTDLTPHDLKAELTDRFSLDRSAGLSVTVRSFSYKRGIPNGADMVMDCRCLRNPYWEASLRTLDGRDRNIQEFVQADPLFKGFYGGLSDMLKLLLPAYLKEGKSYFTLALGCSGGRHRSVTVAEVIAKDLAELGWRISLRHQEL
ncbi:MAG: RNase adapter RapZ [Pseudomonadota bacterium]